MTDYSGDPGPPQAQRLPIPYSVKWMESKGYTRADLSRPWVAGIADIAGDAHAVPARRVQRAERLVVVVVDVGEIAQLRRGQFFLHAQEPHLP